MKRLLTFLAVLFGIPVFGFAVGEGLRRYYEGQVAAVIGGATDQKLRVLALRDVCGAPSVRARLADACDTLDHIILMRDASLWVAVAAVVMIAAIWVAARAASDDRRRLVTLFGPGVRLVLLALFAMVIVQGAIAAYGAYILEAVLIHRYHIALIGGIAIGALLGAWTMMRAGLALSKPSPLFALAAEVSREREPKLWAFVTGIAAKVGAREPQHVLLALDTSFYATAASVTIPTVERPLSGETLCLSLPLLRVLTESELAAVIGHEFGHFKGEDTAYSLRFVPIYSGLGRALHGLSQHRGSAAIALLPAMAVLRFFLERFAAAERTIGRDREIAADRVGASVGGAEALASALAKVSTFAPLWELVGKTMTDMLNGGKSLINASVYFSDNVVAAVAPRVDGAKLFSEIATSRLAHPTDTHPPLSERFAALGVPLSDPTKLLALGGTASSELVANAAEIEQTLTQQLAAIYLRLGRARLPEQKGAVAAPTPSAADRI